MTMEFTLLLAAGFTIGALSAVVGSGGGFLLVPLLLYATDLTPQFIAGTSLTVELLCTASSVYAYHRQCKIDYKVGVLFIAAMLPGIFVGVQLNQMMDTRSFGLMLGAILVSTSVFLLRGFRFRIPHFLPGTVHMNRCMDDSSGSHYEYSLSVRRSVLLNAVVGVVSPMVGIGGGILRTPLMIMVLGMPAKIAAATSILTTFAGSLFAVLLFTGKSQIAYGTAVPLALGLVLGTQAGARFSNAARPGVVRRIMGAVMFGAGAATIITGLI